LQDTGGGAFVRGGLLSDFVLVAGCRMLVAGLRYVRGGTSLF